MGARTGGCQCGKVRYVLDVAELVCYACHCTECQKQSASAFGLSVPLARSELQIEGALQSWRRPTDTGTFTTCYFCPSCGTRLFHVSDRAPQRCSLKGGSLDDTHELRPIAHIWVRSKQPWVVLDPSVPQHPTQPEDLGAWRRSLHPQ